MFIDIPNIKEAMITLIKTLDICPKLSGIWTIPKTCCPSINPITPPITDEGMYNFCNGLTTSLVIKPSKRKIANILADYWQKP